MNRIEQYQSYFRQYGIDFLAESDCDRILRDYAVLNQAHVECPHKPRTYLTKASGNAGRTTVHIAFDKQTAARVGIGSVCFGATAFEAKLTYIQSLVQHGYFALTPDLVVTKPLRF